jgi:hypothetical protein
VCICGLRVVEVLVGAAGEDAGAAEGFDAYFLVRVGWGGGGREGDVPKLPGVQHSQNEKFQSESFTLGPGRSVSLLFRYTGLFSNCGCVASGASLPGDSGTPYFGAESSFSSGVAISMPDPARGSCFVSRNAGPLWSSSAIQRCFSEDMVCGSFNVDSSTSLFGASWISEGVFGMGIDGSRYWKGGMLLMGSINGMNLLSLASR